MLEILDKCKNIVYDCHKERNKCFLQGFSKKSNIIPQKFELYQNYPNPFNPVTKIKFDIPQVNGSSSSDVKLIIYDQLGREVENLVDKELSSGTYEVTWDAGKYSSGIYFFKLSAKGGTGDFSVTKKLMLLK